MSVDEPPGFAAVLRSEWTKLRSVRSTWWTLGLGFAISVGLGAMGGVSVRIALAEHSTNVRSDFSAADTGFYGVSYGLLSLVVFAVLAVTAEYRSGMIRGSLSVVPRRAVFAAAKLTAMGGAVLLVSAVTGFVTFVATEAALDGYGAPLSTPGLAAAMIGATLYPTLICVFSAAIAMLLRGSALTLAILIPLLMIVPVVFANTPGLKPLAQYLPSQAGTQMMLLVKQGTSTLTPAQGLLVLAAWTVAATAAGVMALRARDVR